MTSSIFESIKCGLDKSVVRLDETVTSCDIETSETQKRISKLLALQHVPHKLEQLIAENPENEDYKMAKRILDYFGVAGMGGYTDPKAVAGVRKTVNDYLKERDGFGIDIEDIYFSLSVQMNTTSLIEIVTDKPEDVVVVQSPICPDFAAGCQLAKCAMKEFTNVEDLEKILNDVHPRLVCLTNPADPTGKITSQETMKKIMELCVKHRVMLLVDETNSELQFNDSFVHARVVAKEAGLLDQLEFLVIDSMAKHTVSPIKISVSWTENYNVNPYVLELLTENNASCEIQTTAQSLTALACEFAKLEDCSAVKEVVRKNHEFVSNLKGVSVGELEGSYFIYPTVSVSSGFVAEAKEQGVAVSELYATKLVNAVGVMVVPSTVFEPNNRDVCSFRMAANVILSDDVKAKWVALHETI